MARACVEDTCSINAGNGIGNPNALALNAILDPAGGITCNGIIQPGTPGVGLGVNIPLGSGGCHNILKKDAGTGALSVEQPGVGLATIPDESTILGFSAGALPFLKVNNLSPVVANPFIGCDMLAICYVTLQLNYTVAGAGAAYFLRPISAISASGVGVSSAGFANPFGLPASTSVIQRHDDYGTTAGAGANADIQQQYELVLPAIVSAGGSVTFDIYHNQFQIGNTASLNIRHFPAANPFVETAGSIVLHKLGVVN